MIISQSDTCRNCGKWIERRGHQLKEGGIKWNDNWTHLYGDRRCMIFAEPR